MYYKVSEGQDTWGARKTAHSEKCLKACGPEFGSPSNLLRSQIEQHTPVIPDQGGRDRELLSIGASQSSRIDDLQVSERFAFSKSKVEGAQRRLVTSAAGLHIYLHIDIQACTFKYIHNTCKSRRSK